MVTGVRRVFCAAMMRNVETGMFDVPCKRPAARATAKVPCCSLHLKQARELGGLWIGAKYTEAQAIIDGQEPA